MTWQAQNAVEVTTAYAEVPIGRELADETGVVRCSRSVR
jgi:hypothetical protein